MRGRCFDVCDNKWKTREAWPNDKDAKVEWVGFEANIQWLLYEGWKVFIETNHFTKRKRVLFRHPDHKCYAKADFMVGATICVWSMVNSSRLWDVMVKLGGNIIDLNDLSRSDLLDLLMADIKPKRKPSKKIVHMEEYLKTKEREAA